jgi:hypothetical protein
MKYSKFFIKTIKSNKKLKQLFDDRVPSTKIYLESISKHDLETPFLNTVQFLCDMLLNQPTQSHQYSQTTGTSSISDIHKISPIKSSQNEDFFTEADLVFDNSQESENLMRNVTLQSERLAKLHKQISETMQNNKIILSNPLKIDHGRSRSEIFSKTTKKIDLNFQEL